MLINHSPELKTADSDGVSYDLGSHGWRSIETDDFRRYCRSMKNQLAASDMELDALYGKPRLPRRNLHLAEVSKNSKILSRDKIWNITRDGEFSNLIDRGEKYNWVVDEFGDLICAIEISDGEIKVGHPTVIGDRKARIAGELYFDVGEGCWLLNSDSGAYSRHLWDIGRQSIYLKNVCQYLFQNFDLGDLKVELINFKVRDRLKHKPDQWRTIFSL